MSALRSYLLLLIVFSTNVLSAETTVITGHIAGFMVDPNASLAQIGINEFLSKQRQIRREIQADGSFELEFELEHPQDMYLRAAGIQLSLLISPGDHLEIQWQYTDAEKEDALLLVQFAGDGAARNRDYVALMHRLSSEIDYANNENMHMGQAMQDKSPEEFLAYRLAKKTEEEQLVNEFVRTRAITDSLLLHWINAYLRFKPANDLLVYPLMHAQFNKLKRAEFQVPDSYYRFIEELDINDQSAAICSRYILFLNRDYYMYRRLQTEAQPGFAEKKAREGMVKPYFDHLINSSDGFSRDVILSRFVLEMMEQPTEISGQVPGLLEAYYAAVEDSGFEAAVTKKYKLAFDDRESVMPAGPVSLLEVETTDENLLPDLVRRFPGKVIYIDIWATWCSPCILEMSLYPELIERFRDQDVVFVFLASHSPEKLWKNRISEYQLAGQHYLLTEKQYFALEAYLPLKGFPQHVLINRRGEVAVPQGPPLINSEFQLNQSMVKLLEELLAEK